MMNLTRLTKLIRSLEATSGIETGAADEIIHLISATDFFLMDGIPYKDIDSARSAYVEVVSENPTQDHKVVHVQNADQLDEVTTTIFEHVHIKTG